MSKLRNGNQLVSCWLELCQLCSALLPFCSARVSLTQCGLEFRLRALFSTSLCPALHEKGHHVLGMCSSPQPRKKWSTTHFLRTHLRWQGELHNSHSSPHSQPHCFVPYSPRAALAACPICRNQRMSSLQQHPTILPHLHVQACSDCLLHQEGVEVSSLCP